MRKTKRALLVFLFPIISVLPLVASGCARHTVIPPVPVRDLTVMGRALPLRIGEQIQLAATVEFVNGAGRVVTGEAIWQSADERVAVVSSTGLVTAVRPGPATIVVSFGGLSHQTSLTIIASPIADPIAPGLGLSCGVERWSVKTLSDDQAWTVNLSSAEPTTIKELNGRPAHCEGAGSRRTFGEEFQVFEVVGRVTLIRAETDRDFHIVLRDLTDPRYTIVVEVADPACQGAVVSPHANALTSTRQQFEELLRDKSPIIGELVRVRGVGFYDPDHGQTGRSQNCIELHPLVHIERVRVQ